MRKISPPPAFDPPTVQPVASRYTDCAIQAPCCPYLHTFSLPRNDFFFSEHQDTPSDVSINYTCNYSQDPHPLKLTAAAMCIRLFKPQHKSATFNTTTIQESYNFNKATQLILKHDEHTNQKHGLLKIARFGHVLPISK